MFSHHHNTPGCGRTAATLLTLLVTVLCAQSTAAVAADQKTLASSLEVYVFPQGEQAAGQQAQDEGECYSWAVTSSGKDPFALLADSAATSAEAAAPDEESNGGRQAVKAVLRGSCSSGGQFARALPPPMLLRYTSRKTAGAAPLRPPAQCRW